MQQHGQLLQCELQRDPLKSGMPQTFKACCLMREDKCMCVYECRTLKQESNRHAATLNLFVRKIKCLGPCAPKEREGGGPTTDFGGRTPFRSIHQRITSTPDPRVICAACKEGGEHTDPLPDRVWQACDIVKCAAGQVRGRPVTLSNAPQRLQNELFRV
eukprot:78531-Pelagomonas_calceolata.AAC.5